MASDTEIGYNKLTFLVELLEKEDYELASRVLTTVRDEWLETMYDNLRMLVDMIYSEERKRGYQP